MHFSKIEKIKKVLAILKQQCYTKQAETMRGSVW